MTSETEVASIVAEKAKSRIVVTEDGCWQFQGRLNKGYGYISAGGKNRRVHRATYIAAKGPIPEGFQIDHLCRNKACCNPDHLEAVTPRENTVRGVGPALLVARLRAQTHCKNGHPLFGDNLRIHTSGARVCKICRREYRAAYYQNQKARILQEQSK